MIRIMMTAAFVLAATTAPVIAQTTGSQTGSMGSTGTMGSGNMQSGSMQQDNMSGSSTDAGSSMSKSQMAAMKHCQSSAKAMKTKSCMKMQQMHPEMSSSTNM